MLSNLGIIESNEPFKLVCENDKSGNIEYKLRLDTKSESCLERLVTQCKWRIYQSHLLYKTREVYYVIGIMDDGNLPTLNSGITRDIVIKSVNILKKLMNSSQYEIVDEENHNINEHVIYILKIRPIFECKNTIDEVNVVLTGPSGSGKTSLLSLIVHEEIDDGNGFSRYASLRHEHEKETGYTSCINRKFIGFSGDKLVNEESCSEEGIEFIYSESDRYITIDDLPGCEKYIRTTLFGLLSSQNNITAICIPADNQKYVIEKNAKLYSNIYKICCLRKTKVVFLLTKIDLIPEELVYQCENQVCEYIMKILDIDKINLLNSGDHIYNMDNINNIDSDKPYLIPITNTKADGASHFISYLSFMSRISHNKSGNKSGNKSVSCKSNKIFTTNEIFESPSSGNIFYGYVNGYDNIELGDKLNVITNGKLSKCTVTSIKTKNIEALNIKPGETGSISVKPNIRRYKDAVFFSTLSDLSEITDKALFVTDKKIQDKDYLLFNASTIQSINLTGTINDYKYNITCKKGKKIFIKNNSVCVLKDETGDIIIGLLSSYSVG